MRYAICIVWFLTIQFFTVGNGFAESYSGVNRCLGGLKKAEEMVKLRGGNLKSQFSYSMQGWVLMNNDDASINTQPTNLTDMLLCSKYGVSSQSILLQKKALEGDYKGSDVEERLSQCFIGILIREKLLEQKIGKEAKKFGFYYGVRVGELFAYLNSIYLDTTYKNKKQFQQASLQNLEQMKLIPIEKRQGLLNIYTGQCGWFGLNIESVGSRET